MHGRIPADLLKPSLIFRIESKSRTIHPTVMENTLTPFRPSRQNQHHVRNNSGIPRMRRNRDCLSRESKETEGHENKENESRK